MFFERSRSCFVRFRFLCVYLSSLRATANSSIKREGLTVQVAYSHYKSDEIARRNVELSLPMVRLIMEQRTDAFYPDEAFIVGLRVLYYKECRSMRPDVRRLGSSIDMLGSVYLF